MLTSPILSNKLIKEFAILHLIYYFCRMKKIIIIFFGLIVFLSSCTNHDRKIEYSTLENNVEKNPMETLDKIDSILRILEDGNVSDYMHLSLLRYQAKDLLDKNISKEQDIKKIKAITQFYKEQENNPKLLKLSLYYCGRIYSEQHDAPSALDYYEQAVNINNKDLAFDSKIYSQIGYLFYFQNLNKEAFKNFTFAYTLAKEAKDTMKIVNAMKDIAYVEIANNNYNNAIKTLAKALNIAKSTTSCTQRRINSITSYLAMALNQNGEYTKAKKIIEPVLKEIHPSDTSAVFSIYAEILENLQYDSAAFYYRYLSEKGSIYAQETAFSYLIEAAIKHTKNETAQKYLQQYFNARNNVKKYTYTKSLLQVSKLYNYQQQIKEREIVKNEKKTIIYIASIIVALLVIAILLCLLIIQRKIQHENIQKKRIQILQKIQKNILQQKEKELMTIKDKIAFWENQINSTQIQNQKLQEQLAKEEENYAIKNALYTIEKKERNVAFNTLSKTDIVNKILLKSKAIQREHLTTSEKDEVIQVFKTYLPKFIDDLMALYDLSLQELLVCLLLKLNIKPSSISYLLGTTISSISKIRSRLYKKIFNKDGGAEKWDEFIRSL